jgi:hypothetical protein
MEDMLRKVRIINLRAILGAYRATNVLVLEQEAQVPPLELHLEGAAIKTQGK